jgi:hypothetical protein
VLESAIIAELPEQIEVLVAVAVRIGFGVTKTVA